MDATFRVSVRELVGFSYFPPDIAPMAGVAEMLAGTKAHQFRQTAQADMFQIEKPIRADVPLMGETVTVFGRMDAYQEGEPPVVEEIKLCRAPPEAALPDHLAQARLYGALLCLIEPIAAVDVRVVYVDDNGLPLRVFAAVESRELLLRTLMALLAPWLAFAVPERRRREARDASVRAVAFPFPAYRAGQRELAVQAYTAITRRKRLFVSLPTGTGKSAAVLFPAIKALAEGHTRQIIYLTARTTARQSPLNALQLMRSQGLQIRVSTVTAKEKLCPAPARCHPDDCPRAKGHFLRQPDAVRDLLRVDTMWTDEVILRAAEEHMLCPFELALTLCGLADVVLMDMNYAFDPFAQIARLFQTRRDFTLLADEAHHLLDRVRESLSGTLDTKTLREYRALMGKALGRKHPYLRQINALRGALKALGGLPEQSALKPVEASDSSPASDFSPVGEPAFATEPSPVVETSPAAEPSLAAEAEAAARRTPREYTLAGPPPELVEAAQALLAATFELLGNRLPSAEARREGNRMIRILAPFLYAAYHFDERYAALLTCHGRERLLELYCLSPAETIAQVTRGLRGTVFFSATLSPLPAMRDLLGGGAEDACFSLPSPFPRENLAVIRKRVQTRYAHRAESAEEVARCIAEAAGAHAGRYIAYFPSYAYLSLVYEHLKELPLPPILVQESEMTDEARERFLAAFTGDDRPKLGLCVLGGLFSEGVDLPGEQLIGAMIVGVGLPTPTFRLRTLQSYYEARFGDGFLYAWMIPAMQKVSQAGGRVIRTETDRGLVLLMDDRYFDPRYARLLPEHWALREGGVTEAARALWGGEGNA